MHRLAQGGRELNERTRRVAQGVLLAVAAAAGAGAFFTYRASRSAPTQAGRHGPSVVAVPGAGPVGTRPFLELIGFREGRGVEVLLCARGAAASECVELARGRGGQGRLVSRPIPATLPGPGGPKPVVPGTYDLRAGSGPEPPVRGRFRVIPFTMGHRPPPRSFAQATVSQLVLGRAVRVARGAPCTTAATPDGRLAIGSVVFDPRNAVEVVLGIRAAELAWSPSGDRLALITDDRKELRMAAPDGSEPLVVAREARGFLSSVTWAPDGSRVAYVARPQPGLPGAPRAGVYVLSLLDSSKTYLGAGEAVAWSPTGNRLAVESGRQIQLSDLAGKRTPLADGRAPAWSPDGTLLAFIRPPAETGDGWVTRTDTVALRRMTEGGDVCGFGFTADGAQLVVVRKAGAQTALDLVPIGVRRR